MRSKAVRGSLDLLGCRPEVGLAGLRWVFFALLCDPRSPIGSMLDLGCSCVFDAWRGISTACFPDDAALRGVSQTEP
jgi:hypothetical protein